MGNKVALHNLGCKVNAYETEAMQELLEKHGYEIVPFQEGADVYIINTCTVTNMADRKSRQMLHKARKMNPDSIVVACGCYVQAKKDDIPEGIDIVVGNNKKQNIVEILENYEKEKNPAKSSNCGYASNKAINSSSEQSFVSSSLYLSYSLFPLYTSLEKSCAPINRMAFAKGLSKINGP